MKQLHQYNVLRAVQQALAGTTNGLEGEVSQEIRSKSSRLQTTPGILIPPQVFGLTRDMDTTTPSGGGNLIGTGEKALLVRPCIGSVIVKAFEQDRYYLVRPVKNQG